MKYWRITLAVILAGCIGIYGCGIKKGGAASPEKLFEDLKGKDKTKFSQMIDYVAPDELPIISFSMDFMAAFVSQFSKDKTLAEEYKKIRSKYKLPDPKKKPNVRFNDPASIAKYANEVYGKINNKAFLTDMEGFINKLPGQKAKQGKGKYAKLKDVKINGDKAVGTVVMDNNKQERVNFRKVNGKWYLSIKDAFMR